MSRHLEAVATSTLNQKQSRHQLAKKLRYRHHHLKREGRDISNQGKKVVTSFSNRDTSCIEKKVATTPSCRDINGEDLRSQHHQAVATTGARKRGRNIIKQSRQQEQVKEVATSLSCRDILCKDQKVAIKSSGRDIKYKELRSRRQ